MRSILGILLFTFLFSSCAIIVKSNRQQVFFRGGPDNGVTKVNSPDGTFEVENGQGTYLMTRSKSDIPIKVTCPNGKSKSGIIETRFDWLAGGLGNWWTYFIGSVFDATNDKGYDIEKVSLSHYCNS
jgi:hypothetical protein